MHIHKEAPEVVGLVPTWALASLAADIHKRLRKTQNICFQGLTKSEKLLLSCLV